jgi:hypothetical protein
LKTLQERPDQLLRTPLMANFAEFPFHALR